MAGQTRLLVADTDAGVREVIRLLAADQGWACDGAGDGIAALKLARRNGYHLAVVEIELPELDGRAVCRQLRKLPGIPVIITSRNGKEANRLAGFAAGGNDFVVKPFYPREMAARIKNLLALCGTGPQAGEAIKLGGLRVEAGSHTVYVDGSRVQLSPKEYDLLLFLCKNPGQAFSRDKLLEMVWGADFEGTDRTVDTHVKGLRTKLKPYQGYIETVWGFGYKLESI